ncbi:MULTISPECIES: urease accessory protein UreD [unclassified Undibacterium]|uniref:urease accessory protein UreD n=1 Tax=unclassified Undibacterium TaxID=2630295 RepID=UPI002AC8A73D|nr:MULTISPECIES: urease accessory protein UreD [unclassified Undibacterium]MEB0139307.1 urease accessory protein UreD [Undibacterium sp. CCC2.1]MEB0172151.1 urease accessory protein UreD [Undibacterium sp. CCC1.1]MEB0176058.1 urease accessory protein UreD [Undibacterium sp. CCC3.4]MEB0215370.1 urease accessory protein UreD [Undibacterium sp. 5I2]WPX43444.1 urease accessory protein UreD [Undibacterium sp. CCC3.4]
MNSPPVFPRAPTSSDWEAHLQLGFQRDATSTRLTHCRHHGPLRVQKTLYPEGSEVCHAIIIHPPGGVVGGDRLKTEVHVAADTRVLITTPGAAKWYRSNGQISQQDIALRVAAGAQLEWLPQESIFFDDARVILNQTVQLDEQASFISSDIFCFGRSAAAERYASGTITQCSRILRGEQLIWHEQGSIEGAGAAMQSPLGLAGRSVCASVLGCGNPLSAAALQALRAQSSALLAAREETALGGVSQMKSVIVARYLGNSSETARLWQQLVWQHLRPALMGREAVVPRIWQT